MIWLCNPWETFIASLIADGDRQEREWHKEQDLEEEQLLAQDFFDDLEEDGDAEWPSYADLPYVIQEPEIFQT